MAALKEEILATVRKEFTMMIAEEIAKLKGSKVEASAKEEVKEDKKEKKDKKGRFSSQHFLI